MRHGYFLIGMHEKRIYRSQPQRFSREVLVFSLGSFFWAKLEQGGFTTNQYMREFQAIVSDIELALRNPVSQNQGKSDGYCATFTKCKYCHNPVVSAFIVGLNRREPNK